MNRLRNWLQKARLGHVIFGLVFVAASLILWRVSVIRDRANLQAQVEAKARSYASEAESRYSSIGSALGRMANRGMPQPGAVHKVTAWTEEAAFYRDTFAGLEHVIWVDPSFRVLLCDPYQDVLVDRPFNDVNWGMQAVNLWVPIYKGTQLEGFVVGIIDMAAFMSPVELDAMDDYAFQLSSRNEQAIASHNWLDIQQDLVVSKTIALPNAAVWIVSLAPTQHTVRTVLARSRTTLGFSLFLSLMATIALYFAQRYRELADLNEMRFRQMLESMLEGCQIIGSDWRFRFVNDAAARLYHRRCDELIGLRMHEVIPDLETTPIYLLLQRCMQDRTPQHMLDQIALPDGSLEWHELSIQPAPDGVLVLGSNVTERMQNQVALQESEARFRTITNSSPDAIFIIDQQGHYTYANPAACRLLGYTKTELDQMSIADIGLGGHGGSKPSERLGRILTEGHLSTEIEMLRRDGTKVPADLNAVVLPNSMIYGSCRDISERRQAAQEQEKLEIQLRQAQKMEAVGQLAGGVAHDFNNMLAVIIGHTEILQSDLRPDDEMHEGLDEIMTAARRSADLTKQLLAFARQQTIAPAIMDLNQAVGAALKMLRRLVGEDIHITWRPQATLWAIKMDSVQIDQILANLVVNARDAITGVGHVNIETGHVSVDASYCEEHADATPGDYVMLSVTDDGCGMDETVMSHLFEPFYTTKEVGKGTGLGLATIYGILRQNDGFVTVRSKVGQGTTFRLHFPRVNDETLEAPPPEEPEVLRGKGEVILLVEDEPAILRITSQMLRRAGYAVHAASDPNHALQTADKLHGSIDLLVTDVVMPHMSGWDLAQQLRQQQQGLRCLFISGYTANIIEDRGVLADGIQYLQKPFTMHVLADKVRELLEEPAPALQGPVRQP